MTTPIFITGIGTDVGKTIVSAILTEALQADYWKPVQAGFDDGTDNLRVEALLSNSKTVVHTEAYKLALPASPHIAARKENITVSLDVIAGEYTDIRAKSTNTLIIEGAGGILVPLNDNEFVADLIVKLQAKVILVSRNYLGSINHSLLTAELCKQKGIDVIGWVFNEQYMHYEEEIVQWSGYPRIASIPRLEAIDKTVIQKEAARIQQDLLAALEKET
ncbi:MAG: dethiobiotin synthase [Filimonas sp.]|nr:dethiobiotin synthase [Filimonas sp.]